jgi:hypothetical protein
MESDRVVIHMKSEHETKEPRRMGWNRGLTRRGRWREAKDMGKEKPRHIVDVDQNKCPVVAVIGPRDIGVAQRGSACYSVQERAERGVGAACISVRQRAIGVLRASACISIV